ncbi:hypothetical protein [Mycolicibacterium llatzerense]|uniref:hypothetical protein n=1 Tax=Mycolicibacterium llatzerense TaxID=280871 RepID=UPI0021B6839C|nr:hypothetical protein [Mycolicibacterium llatzerense]MCT7361222.1 hypothetical protein [Mycolicibacterium llatzerense]
MGAEDGGGGTDAGAGTAPDGGGQQQVTQQPSGADAGFPANTPVSEMTDTQRAAYYKHHNRQSDNKLAAFKGVTPQDVDAMQAKIQELENAQLSATDKALKDAATQASMDAKAAADAEWLPKLQAAQLKSIAAPILNDAERLNDFLEMVNPANFVGENGEIDEGKVATKLKSLFGAQSQQQQQPARNWGQHSGGTGTPATPGSAGKAEAAKRFGSKT